MRLHILLLNATSAHSRTEKGRLTLVGTSLIMVSSITHAIRGRNLLKKRGFRATIEKTPGNLDTAGCGYSIAVGDRLDAALKIVTSAGIKVIGTTHRQ